MKSRSWGPEVKDCNKVKTFSNQNSWSFAENLNIDETCLNNYKKGIAILASKFVNSIVHWYDPYLTTVATPNVTATSSAQITKTLMPKCRGLKLASLNISSLLKHTDEFCVFLNDENIERDQAKRKYFRSGGKSPGLWYNPPWKVNKWQVWWWRVLLHSFKNKLFYPIWTVSSWK